MIRYLGLGLEEAYHPWSENGYTFTAQELLDHFINVVLPLEKTSDLPTEAPTTAPPLPTLQAVGTIFQLALEKDQTSQEEDEKFKVDAKAKLARNYGYLARVAADNSTNSKGVEKYGSGSGI